MAAIERTPPPLPPAVAPRRATPRRLVGAVLTLGLAAGCWLWLRDPQTAPGLFPPCVWRAATGTHCPGCGITRALHDLLHGRVLAALGHNALGLLVLLATAALLARPVWTTLRENRWTPPILPRHTARWLLLGGLVWAVLRNLPWAPFTALAP